MSDLMKLAQANLDRPVLKRVCEMHEDDFGSAYDMTRVEVAQPEPSNFYYFKDNGSKILAVAHLDTVVDHAQRLCNFIDTAGGPIVYSGALDDRLGAYIILELLPKLGIEHDVLLTVGEESGISTAAFFEPGDHHERDYNWIIEFDRGGTDVVMYQYEDRDTAALVEATGARVAEGIFSDISYMEHVGLKAFNWGVGYRDYHSVRGHAYLDDTAMMVGYYLAFYVLNSETVLPHEERSSRDSWWGGYHRFSGYDPSTCDNCFQQTVDVETDWCTECSVCNSCWMDTSDGSCECSWSVNQKREDERAEALREIEDVWVREEVL